MTSDHRVLSRRGERDQRENVTNRSKKFKFLLMLIYFF